MDTLTLQDAGKLPYPVVEGDERSRARALATIHSHPVVSHEGPYHCACPFACTSTLLPYSTSIHWYHLLVWVENAVAHCILCVQWNSGWPTIILNLGLWDFRVLCSLFETMSQCIQWVCYPIHILLLQYGSLNRCVVSIYYYVKVRWQSLCHNNRWYQCTFCTQNCISCAIHQKQLSYMYNFV